MPAWIKDSRPYLEKWIDQHDVDRSSVERLVEGMNLSERREPTTESAVQRPEVLIPGLTAAPWWDAGIFPWISELEAAYEDIKAEFQAVGGLRADRAIQHPNSGNLAEAGAWSAYYFHMLGKDYPEHIRDCPRTMDALSSADGVRQSGMCYFSVMTPGTRVAPHCGFINARIRCHLGLVVPEGARMRVGEETRPWTEGRAFVFDDSFEHEVFNDGEHGRAVLLFDVWHPDLTEVEKRALTHMMPVWRSFLYRDDAL